VVYRNRLNLRLVARVFSSYELFMWITFHRRNISSRQVSLSNTFCEPREVGLNPALVYQKWSKLWVDWKRKTRQWQNWSQNVGPAFKCEKWRKMTLQFLSVVRVIIHCALFLNTQFYARPAVWDLLVYWMIPKRCWKLLHLSFSYTEALSKSGLIPV